MRLSSNLYKQYNVAQKTERIRMIDSNDMIQEKLSELSKKLQIDAQTDKGDFADGFVEGLTPESARKVLLNPEELTNKAKEDSKQIMEDAKVKAKAMLDDARKKADELRKKAIDEGYQEGYQSGNTRIREELDQEYREKEEKLDQQRIQYLEEYNQKMSDLEPQLLEVIVNVIEKVFHIQFCDKTDILLYLIQNAILNIENSRSFHVRVGDEQRLFLEKHKGEILERVGNDISVDILSDPLLEGTQCVIETETGVFDCSLDVQLENLIKDIRSLSS